MSMFKRGAYTIILYLVSCTFIVVGVVALMSLCGGNIGLFFRLVGLYLFLGFVASVVITVILFSEETRGGC